MEEPNATSQKECEKCGSKRWIKWADGQNYTCQKCGNSYNEKPVKIIGDLSKLGEKKNELR
jgi:ribosomal protein L37AE/L43A